MDILGPTQSYPLVTLAGPSSSTTQWQVGQRLDAVVVSLLSQDRVTLQIGSALLEARTSLATAPGQRLALEVVQIDNQTVLRIIPGQDKIDAMTAAQRATPPTQTLTLLSSTSSLAPLQLGQRVEAVVVSLLGQDKLSLQIGNAQFEARSSTAATPGQRLSLEVVQIDKQPILRVVADATKADPLMTALRTALPKQVPLQAAFTQFSQLLASSPGLPTSVTALLKQLIQQLPNEQTITRLGALKQAFMDSGLFLEHKLKTDAQPPQLDKDTKASLLRLLGELNQGQGNTTADLTRQVEAALSRIQLHQLAALSQEQPPVTWAGELPVRHSNQVDVFQFRIEKDAKQSGDSNQTSWCTWLSLNLQALGPLHVKILLTQQNISTAFWAESKATADLVNQHISYLAKSLEQAGLEVKDIQCRQGRPPFPPTDRLPKGLLDLIA